MTPEEDALRIYSSVYHQIGSSIIDDLYKKDVVKEMSVFVVDEIESALKNCAELNYDLQNMEREFAHWDKTRNEIEKI